MLKKFKDHDWLLTAIVVILTAIGVMTLYSVTVDTANEILFKRQIMFGVTGILLYFLVSLVESENLRYPVISLTIYGLCIIGLIITYFFGQEIRGAKRWIEIGTFTLQFGEFAKIGLILAVGCILNWQADHDPDDTPKKPKTDFKTKVKNYLLSSRILFALLICLPAVALLMLQPSYGSAGMLLLTALVTAFLDENDKIKSVGYLIVALFTLAGILLLNSPNASNAIVPAVALLATAGAISFFGIITKKLALPTIIILVIISATIGLGWRWAWNNVLLSYHQSRIQAFLGLGQDLAEEFQTRQSMIAIGSGQMFGQGFAQGQQTRLRFLPDYHTDFIFAAFAEEFGFRGVAILLALYLSLFVLISKRADKVNSRFGRNIITGSLIMLLTQFAINIGMNTGILPVLGIPLPLMSYGGSTLWTTTVLIALSQGFKLRREGTTQIARIRGWQK